MVRPAAVPAAAAGIGELDTSPGADGLAAAFGDLAPATGARHLATSGMLA